MASPLSLAARDEHASAHLDALWAAALALPVVAGFRDAFWLAVVSGCVQAVGALAFFFAGTRLEASNRAALSGGFAAVAASAALAVWRCPLSAPASAAVLIPMAIVLEAREVAQPQPLGLAWAARRAARASWLTVDLFALAFLAEAMAFAQVSLGAGMAVKFAALACAWAAARRAARRY